MIDGLRYEIEADDRNNIMVHILIYPFRTYLRQENIYSILSFLKMDLDGRRVHLIFVNREF